MTDSMQQLRDMIKWLLSCSEPKTANDLDKKPQDPKYISYQNGDGSIWFSRSCPASQYIFEAIKDQYQDKLQCWRGTWDEAEPLQASHYYFFMKKS